MAELKDVNELELIEELGEGDSVLAIQGGVAKRISGDKVGGGGGLFVYGLAQDETTELWYLTDEDGNELTDPAPISANIEKGSFLLKIPATDSTPNAYISPVEYLDTTSLGTAGVAFLVLDFMNNSQIAVSVPKELLTQMG